MNPSHVLAQAVSEAFQQAFSVSVEASQLSFQQTRPEFEGDLTLVTFPFQKLSGKNPEETGRALGESLVAQADSVVARYNVVKGFLNLVLADSVWLAALACLPSPAALGQKEPNGKRILVEYSSPNTNKPLHLGHLRNIFLGYSVAQILKAAGYEVVQASLVNDRGIHICKSMIAYQLFGQGETPASRGIKGDHLVGDYYVRYDQAYKQQVKDLIAQGLGEEEAKKQTPILKQAQEMLRLWEAGDAQTVALWQQMNGWVYEGFGQTYQRLGVSFDKYYYESDTYKLGKDIVQEGLDKGVFFRKDDGSVWVDLTAEGLDEKLVLRGDGTSVYITQDLGTADLKYQEYGTERSIFVVGNEQDYHFKVLFLILAKLGRSYAPGMFHLSYGMVELPEGKMKSREGTVVDADDLIDEMVAEARSRTSELGKIDGYSATEQQALYELIGLGAIKYFLLRVDPKKKMLFNPSESISLQGDTATFVQYTHARIRSVCRKAQEQGITPLRLKAQLEPQEKELIKLLSQFPTRIDEAAKAYSPSVLVAYVYEVAKEFNRFFNDLSILNAESAEVIAFRVGLAELTGATIKRCFALLGIEVPERM